jgi:hypothetical protein
LRAACSQAAARVSARHAAPPAMLPGKGGQVPGSRGSPSSLQAYQCSPHGRQAVTRPVLCHAWPAACRPKQRSGRQLPAHQGRAGRAAAVRAGGHAAPEAGGAAGCGRQGGRQAAGVVGSQVR